MSFAERLRVLKGSAASGIKLLYALIWGEETLPIPPLTNSNFLNALGYFGIKFVNAGANIINIIVDKPNYDSAFQVRF